MPDASLTLTYVYGFNGKNAKQHDNIFINIDGDLVYAVGATCVKFRPGTNAATGNTDPNPAVGDGTQGFMLAHTEA